VSKHSLQFQKLKFVKGLALGAAAVLCSWTPLAHANLVTNGGFETGDLSGWSLSPGGPYDKVCTTGQVVGAATCMAHTGLYAMTLGLNGALDTLSQVLGTTAGTRYSLSFWLANDNPAAAATEEFDVLWNGTAVLNIGPGTVGTFAYGLNTFVVTGTGSDTLKFVARHDPSQWFLDDVGVNAVPEPGSLALACLALAGLGMTAGSRKT